VPGEAWNAGFCTIYPRASGGLERPPKPTDIKGATFQFSPANSKSIDIPVIPRIIIKTRLVDFDV
jgi:hypothetical protein